VKRTAGCVEEDVVEHHRKDAKRLLRAFRAGDADAVRRVELVLGERARERFLLSDAQHVVAVEQGYRTWPELVRESTHEERIVATAYEYSPGDPVVVRVVHRGRKTGITDDGAAIERAGRPEGWREVAKRIDDELIVNVSRHGVVSLPVVRRGPDEDAIVDRIARASLALYHDLLDSTE
jgi:hypothetical protein